MKKYIIASIFCMSVSVAQGATYWARPTGTMSGCTPSATPPATDSGYKATVAAGIGCLSGGDILQIRAGTYTAGIMDTVPSGSAGSPTTISGYPGDARPVLQGAVYTGPSRAYINFTDIIVDASNNTYAFAAGLEGEYPDHLNYLRVDAKNARTSGMLIYATNSTIASCNVFYNGSSQYDHGMYLEGSFNVIEKNDVYGNAAFGIHIYNVARPPHDFIVRNNRTHNNARVSAGGASLLAGGDNHLIYNNLVYDDPNQEAGIMLRYSGTNRNGKVYNNTVYNAGSIGIQLVGSGHIARNNISWGGSITTGVQTNGNTADNNMTTNPLFVNAASSDFRIQSGSSARDTGLTIAAVPNDFDGYPRPQGSAYDLGAHEFQQAEQLIAPTNLAVSP